MDDPYRKREESRYFVIDPLLARPIDRKPVTSEKPKLRTPEPNYEELGDFVIDAWATKGN